jgi:hypothetical protein
MLEFYPTIAVDPCEILRTLRRDRGKLFEQRAGTEPVGSIGY